MSEEEEPQQRNLAECFFEIFKMAAKMVAKIQQNLKYVPGWPFLIGLILYQIFYGILRGDIQNLNALVPLVAEIWTVKHHGVGRFLTCFLNRSTKRWLQASVLHQITSYISKTVTLQWSAHKFGKNALRLLLCAIVLGILAMQHAFKICKYFPRTNFGTIKCPNKLSQLLWNILFHLSAWFGRIKCNWKILQS